MCEYCGSTKNVIHHHRAYKELQGYDDVIMVCRSCHKKIDHRQIFINVSVKDIAKYSARASCQNKLRKEKRKETYDKYAQHRREYNAKNIYRFGFSESVDENINLIEDIIYNEKTGYVFATSRFTRSHDRKLLFIDIEE